MLRRCYSTSVTRATPAIVGHAQPALRNKVIKEAPRVHALAADAFGACSSSPKARPGHKGVSCDHERSRQLPGAAPGCRRACPADRGGVRATARRAVGQHRIQGRAPRRRCVSFVHVSSADTPDGSNPLPEPAAFGEFGRDSASRVATTPVPVAADIIGSYYPTVPVTGAGPGDRSPSPG
jgi:hypothetical protein